MSSVILAQSAQSAPGVGPTTRAVTINTATGSGLMVVTQCDWNHFTSMTDSKSLTWTTLGNQTIGGSVTQMANFWNYGGARGSSHTFTLTMNTGGFKGYIGVLEFTGLNLSTQLDQATNFSTDNATPFLSAVVTPTVIDAYLVSYFCVSSGATSGEVDTWAGSFALGDKILQFPGPDGTGSVAGRGVKTDTLAGYNSSITTTTITGLNGTAQFFTILRGTGVVAPSSIICLIE